MRSPRSSTSTRKPAALSSSANLGGILQVTVSNGNDDRLNRVQPHREGTRVMLDEHTEETFQAAQQGAVHHVWAVRLTVFADVGEIKTFRFVEIELDGGKLPFTPDGILDLEVDLGAIERSTAFIDFVIYI